MRAADGTRLAYAVHGSGPPLIVVSCWLSHLQHDWESPVWRHFLDDLGSMSTLVRYDERGFGMSDWKVTDFSMDARVRDLEAIVDALGFERFAVLGMSNGSGVAMAYAARHPERVTRLVLNGTVCGERPTFDEDAWAEEQAYRSLIQVGWAREDPVFRRVFTSRYIPDATEEQMRWFDDLQRMSGPAENVLAVATRAPVRGHLCRGGADPGADADPPGDRRPVDDLRERRDGRGAHPPLPRRAARQPQPHPPRRGGLRGGPSSARSRVPGARPSETPARQGRTTSKPSRGASSRSCSEPLRASRTMRSRRRMGLSPRTVERHLSNAYAKLGISGKAARAAARLAAGCSGAAWPDAAADLARPGGAGTVGVTPRAPTRRHYVYPARPADGAARRLGGTAVPEADPPSLRSWHPAPPVKPQGDRDDHRDPPRDQRPIPGRSRGRAHRPERDRDPRQRPRPPVGRAVQLGIGPAGVHRWRQPRAEPDRLPPRRPRRLRRRIPQRHPRARVRRRPSTGSRRSRGARPTWRVSSASKVPCRT